MILKLSGVIPPSVFKFAWWFLTFHFVAFSLVFFRSPTLRQAMNYYIHIPQINSFKIAVLNDRYELIISFLLILLVQTIHYFKPDHKVYELIINKNLVFRWSVYLIFIFVIVFFSVVRKNPFIYFQF